MRQARHASSLKLSATPTIRIDANRAAQFGLQSLPSQTIARDAPKGGIFLWLKLPDDGAIVQRAHLSHPNSGLPEFGI
jgi:hypothetical protein